MKKRWYQSKTIIASIATIIIAIGGWWRKDIDTATAISMISSAIIGMGIRDSIGLYGKQEEKNKAKERTRKRDKKE